MNYEAHTNIENFKGAQSSPQAPISLAFCTQVQDDVLNQWYKSQTRTRSYVLAHTNNENFKGGSKLHPSTDMSGFLHTSSG